MARGPEQVFIGRANRSQRVLQKAGVDLTEMEADSITRVQVWVNETICLDTDIPEDPIEYADGVVTMQLGLVSGLVPGEYEAFITCYDAVTPDGYAWGSFELEAKLWNACDD